MTASHYAPVGAALLWTLEKGLGPDFTPEAKVCLIPGFDGAVFSQAWRDALWARFFTAAPPRQRRSVGSVERYSIVKRA